MSEPQPWSPLPEIKPWRTEFAQAESAQPLIQPLVIGRCWGDGSFIFGSEFLDYNQWLGGNDLSAPAAIEYQETNIWPALCQRCRELAHQAAQRTGRLSNS